MQVAITQGVPDHLEKDGYSSASVPSSHAAKRLLRAVAGADPLAGGVR